ncbi:hypothetical protein EJ06DRAFT_534796 [Trichodelitschia bisporula]|uniref:Uncharacterized protein n=1 Tax=Trichodelitschia bisporula TaxID=703511 RepID=A0A6G1HHW4_9PEZI|nr:hypothetical protein EJ06DRAFT_534796 [Trichodelitschia bisporula]
MCDGPDFFLALLAILFPPVAVWVKRGICSADSLINFALLCLGYVPGLIHAWYIISKYPSEYEAIPDSERGGATVVTYYYVQPGSTPPPSSVPVHPSAAAHSSTYGTTGNTGSTSAPAPKSKGAAKPSARAPAPAPNGESSAQHDVPPSYADVIKGDHKVQTK